MRPSFFSRLSLFLIGLGLAACGLTVGPAPEPVPTRPPLAQVTLVAPPTPFVTPLPGRGGSGPEATLTAMPSSTATAVPTITSTPSPTNTAMPTATVCFHDMQFVADVTIPDNTVIEPGALFVKTWRIRNSGSCDWPPGTSWVFAAGAMMNGPSVVAVPSTRPGETADISVNLTAPQQAGAYTGYWTLRLPDGSVMTDRYFVRVVVPGPPTVTSFSATAVEPFDGAVTLSWTTRFADSVTATKVLPSGAQADTWTLPANGSQAVTIGLDELQMVRFRLTAVSQRGLSSAWEQSVAVTCAYAWFFSPPVSGCPAATAVVTNAVMQTFENGTMVWLQAPDDIYVLYHDAQTWDVYPNTWQESETLPEPETPPAGYFAPQAALGKVWQEAPDVRDILGWAINPPTSYRAFYQTGLEPTGESLYIETPVTSVWWLQLEPQTWQRR